MDKQHFACHCMKLLCCSEQPRPRKGEYTVRCLQCSTMQYNAVQLIVAVVQGLCYQLQRGNLAMSGGRQNFPHSGSQSVLQCYGGCTVSHATKASNIINSCRQKPLGSTKSIRVLTAQKRMILEEPKYHSIAGLMEF